MDPHHIHVQDIHVARSGYVELTKINDGHDGNLCVLEQHRDVPFEVKRIYYINNLRTASVSGASTPTTHSSR